MKPDNFDGEIDIKKFGYVNIKTVGYKNYYSFDSGYFELPDDSLMFKNDFSINNSCYWNDGTEICKNCQS